MPAYPAPIDHAAFTDPLDVGYIQGARAGDLDPFTAWIPRARPGSGQQAVLRLPSAGVEFGIETFSVKANKGGAKAQVFTSDEEPGEVTDRLCFAPGTDDELTVAWTFRRHVCIDKAKLELFRAGAAEPLWTREKMWAGTPAEDGDFIWEGRLDADDDDRRDEVEVTLHETEAFPDKLLTAEFSPYKLKLTVGGEGDAPRAAAWVYLDVLVHEVALDWGDAGWIPANRTEPGSVLKKSHATYRAFEVDLLDRLSGTAAGDPALAHEIVLEVNEFGVKTPDQPIKPEDDFKAYQACWGDGPRIPLQAAVTLRTSEGNGVAAPKALGRMKLLWDWEEPKDDAGAPLWSKALGDASQNGTLAAGDLGAYAAKWKQDVGAAKTYLERARALEGAQGGPPGASNCPAKFGGKRGPKGAPVFPPQTGTAPAVQANTFPFEVAACANRTWAAHSTVCREGDLASSSGVLFQPSRMAGDTWRVRVITVYGDDLDDARAIAVDEEGTHASDDPTAWIAPARTAATGSFATFRAVKVRYVHRGVSQLDWDGVKQLYELIGVRLVVEPAIALDERRYGEVYTATIDALCGEEKWVRDRDPLEPFLRYALDPDQAPGSPALIARTYDGFKEAYRTAFQKALVFQIDAHKKGDGDILHDRVTGATSGAEGLLVDRGGARPFTDRKAIIVSLNGRAFQKGEHITMATTGGEAKIDAVQVLSFYDAPTFVLGDESSSERVDVTLRGQTHTVKFGKFSDSVGSSESQKLEAFFAEQFPSAVAAGVGPAGVEVTVNGRQKHSKDRRRRDAVEAAIRDLFVAKKTAFEAALGASFPTARERDYGEHAGRVNSILIEKLLRAYVAADPANEGWEGLVLLHINGKTNLDPLKVTGASYPEEADPQQGVAFVSTRQDGFATEARGKPILYKPATSVAAHELGHALYLPHAPRKQDGATTPGDVEATHHDANAGCIMNYDQDTVAFCGRCALRLSGWNWSKVGHSL